MSSQTVDDYLDESGAGQDVEPTSTVKALKNKPLDSGFKRNLIILGVVVFSAVSIVFGILLLMSPDRKDANQSAAHIGSVRPNLASGEKVGVSEAMRQREERLQREEAAQAAARGQTYIPVNQLGEPIPVEQELSGPPPSRYAQSARGPRMSNQNDPNYLKVQAGFERQLAAIANGMPAPRAVTVMGARNPMEQQPQANQAASPSSGAPAKNVRELVGGLEIVAGRLTTAVNTDKGLDAMAEIVGGPLDGAMLVGRVTVFESDVAVQFNAMRHNGKMYTVDAVGLNEMTARQALDGNVDRRIFSRYVMPILAAGLDGLGTYFKVLGTPEQTSLAGGGYSDNGTIISDNIVLDRRKATKEEARQQGIGDMTDEAANMIQREVARNANRPNKITLDANTAIGIMFRQPVLEQ